MKYILLIYADSTARGDATEANDDQMNARYRAFTAELAASGRLGPAEELDSPARAKSVRRRDGDVTVTNGPFAEVREQLGGFYVVEAESIDEAVAWAARVPSVDVGTIEVRPIIGNGGDPEPA
jgi:hypothetical protein